MSRKQQKPQSQSTSKSISNTFTASLSLNHVKKKEKKNQTKVYIYPSQGIYCYQFKPFSTLDRGLLRVLHNWRYRATVLSPPLFLCCKREARVESADSSSSNAPTPQRGKAGANLP